MCRIANSTSPLGSHHQTSSATLRSVDARLKMGSHSRKRTNSKSIVSPGKAALSSLEVSAGSNVVAKLNPSLPNLDGRATTHHIDTHGSVQALVVDNDVVIAGLQDGTLSVSNLLVFTLLPLISLNRDGLCETTSSSFQLKHMSIAFYHFLCLKTRNCSSLAVLILP